MAETDIKGGHSKWVLAKSKISSREAANLRAGNPNAVAAMGDSKVAAKEVFGGSRTVKGATQYRTRFSSDVTTPVGKFGKNPGTPVSAHFGPFNSSIGPSGIGVIVIAK